MKTVDGSSSSKATPQQQQQQQNVQHQQQQQQRTQLHTPALTPAPVSDGGKMSAADSVRSDATASKRSEIINTV